MGTGIRAPIRRGAYHGQPIGGRSTTTCLNGWLLLKAFGGTRWGGHARVIHGGGYIGVPVLNSWKTAAHRSRTFLRVIRFRIFHEWSWQRSACY
ncbi:hypothetical protein BDV32DRAFT_115841 [Aspergillus pseudonomiae]|nr:hypothetical protein BDV32DRAFT_115841 [Aspergillus pseudonomiae]